MFIVLDATAFTDMRFGQGSGPIFVDNAACFGDELRLISCTYDSHTSDCTHAEDAGLRCSGRCKLCVCKIDYLMMLNCVQCSVSMVISDLLVETMTWRAESKFVSMRPGVLSVMVAGQPLMPLLPVVNLVSNQLELCHSTMLHLVLAPVRFGLMISCVTVENKGLLIARMEELALLTSAMATMMMLD